MRNKPVTLAMVAGIAVGVFAVLVFRPALFGSPVDVAMVRETLRAHPEIILEALQVLQDRRDGAGRVQQSAAIAANREALFRDKNSFVGGNPQGDVSVVEFFDYRCPYCRQSMVTVRALIKADPQVRLVYKEFPILGAQSLTAARVAVAARNDPRYEALHDALMLAPSPLDEEQVLQIAATAGLDRAALAAAMRAPEVEEILKANHALARELGINGTPAFVVGETLVPGVASLDDLKRLVGEARARGGDRAAVQSGG